MYYVKRIIGVSLNEPRASRKFSCIYILYYSGLSFRKNAIFLLKRINIYIQCVQLSLDKLFVFCLHVDVCFHLRLHIGVCLVFILF